MVAKVCNIIFFASPFDVKWKFESSIFLFRAQSWTKCFSPPNMLDEEITAFIMRIDEI